MKTAGVALITGLLMFGAGCVQQPDWIESTLMTVDVTGRWEGSVLAPLGSGGNPAIPAYLDLEQEGAKVRGKLETSMARISGPIEGRVGGDRFQFSVLVGQGERSTAEVTVSGDEMEGLVTLFGVGPHTSRISLRRVPSPTPQSN